MATRVREIPKAETGAVEEPLYARVAAALRGEIARGVHPIGAQLPPEDRLAAHFAVSRHTLREALRRLREEGLIASRRGAGTVVVPPRTDAHVLHAMSIGDLVAFAAGARLTLDTVQMVRIDEAASLRTGIAAGEDWLRCAGTRREAAAPVTLCVSEHFIPRRFAAVSRQVAEHDGAIFALIEDMFAVRIAAVEQEVGAIAVAEDAAALLAVEPGSIGLEVRRTYRLADGAVAQVTLNTHPAARFRHSMTLYRTLAG